MDQTATIVLERRQEVASATHVNTTASSPSVVVNDALSDIPRAALCTKGRNSSPAYWYIEASSMTFGLCHSKDRRRSYSAKTKTPFNRWRTLSIDGTLDERY